MTHEIIIIWDISVGIATDWTAEVRFPVGAKDFSLLHIVDTGPAANPTGGCLPGGNTAGA
jgi:hypothetical protein